MSLYGDSRFNMKNIIVISSGYYTNFCNTLRKLQSLKSRIKVHIYAPYENDSLSKLKDIFDIRLTRINKKPTHNEYSNISTILNKKNSTVLVYSKYLIPSCIYNKTEAINFHPSRLPLYPGLDGWENAIKNKHLGFTAHKIDDTIDLGKKLISCEIKPFPDMSIDNIRITSHNLCQTLSEYIIKNFVDDTLRGIAYRHIEGSSIEYIRRNIL